MGEVLQDDGAAGQQRRLPEDLAGSRAGHGQVGEHLMQPGGRPQLRELILDDQGVDRLGDRDERDLLLEDDQRQPVILRRLDEAGRQAAGIPAAQLDRHRTHADSGEVGDVRIQQRRRLGQRDPGGQHQLAAAQQPRRVGQLDRMHPAHRRVQPPGTRHDAGPPSPDSVERQDLCHRPQHDASPAVTYIVSGSGCRIFHHDEPGPGRLGSMSELHERHRRVIPNWVALYYDDPLELVSGSGSRVTDATGHTYLDFFCGILTNMLGYDVPEVREAIQRQLGTGIVHTSTLYLIRNQVELAEKLARLSGIENAKVFFTNSGTEANETALMLATAARRSNQVLALRNSYHGRSFGAVAITGNGAWKSSPLAPFSVHYLHGTDRHLPAFASLDDAGYSAACVEDLRHVLSTATAGDVACLIAEPVQGVGGFTMPPDGLLGEYAAVLRERGALLISDEVQTAWGRTGEHFWGIGAHGVTPDIITFAKGLGNGLAIGGVIARGDLMDGLPGNGISTFGGNPLSTAAANATLDYVLSHDLQHNAAELGAMIIGGLQETAAQLDAVGEVRGKGLMFAVDLVEPGTGAPSPRLAARVLAETRERGLLIGKGGLYGHALRMAPPMTLSEADAKEGLGILTDALRAVNAEAAS